MKVKGKGKSPPTSMIEEGERYRHLFEQTPIMIFITDKNGTILDINRAGAEMLGYSSTEELIGLDARYHLYVNPEDRLVFQQLIERKGYVREFETQMRKKDGSIIDVSITSAIRRDKEGNITGYEGFVMDITDKKRTQRILQESEERYRTVLENSLVGICFHQNGLFQYLNRRLVTMLGYQTADELVGKPFWELIHPDDREIVKKRGIQRQKNQFQPQQYTFRALRKDGSVLWAELWASPATFRGHPAVVVFVADISERLRAEEEIRHLSRRLIEVSEEEKKKLAADLHDEFGQHLTSLHFGLEVLEMSLPEEELHLRERCRVLIKQVEKMAEQIRKKISVLRPDVLDHLGLIPAMEWYIQDYIRDRPELNVSFEAIGFKKRPPLQTEIVLYRIFQECMTNIAKHARATEVKIVLVFSYPRIILNIKDNGVGYNPEDLQNEKGKPRGVGILSMRERVGSAGGSMSITSAPGKGTSVRVEIPVTDERT